MTYSTIPNSLPWAVNRLGNANQWQVRPANGNDWRTVASFVQSAGHDRNAEQDAAYAVHACNTYPRLVEALKAATQLLNAEYSTGRLIGLNDGTMRTIKDAARAALQEAGEAQ